MSGAQHATCPVAGGILIAGALPDKLSNTHVDCTSIALAYQGAGNTALPLAGHPRADEIDSPFLDMLMNTDDFPAHWFSPSPPHFLPADDVRSPEPAPQSAGGLPTGAVPIMVPLAQVLAGGTFFDEDG